MVQSDSQATVEYSYNVESSRRVSDRTYSGSNKCDRDTSVYSYVLDTDLSQACDVLLQQSDGFADRQVGFVETYLNTTVYVFGLYFAL